MKSKSLYDIVKEQNSSTWGEENVDFREWWESYKKFVIERQYYSLTIIDEHGNVLETITTKRPKNDTD